MNDGKGLHLFQNTFEKGMNRDASFGRYPNNSFFNIKNLKLYSNKEGSYFDIENIDSDRLVLKVTGGFIPKKIVEGADAVFLLGGFIGKYEVGKQYSFCIYRIDKAKLQDNSGETLSLDSISKYTKEAQHGSILLHGGYDPVYEVDFAVYNHESYLVQKLYWKDDLGYRFVDIQKSTENYWTLEETRTYSALLEIPAQFDDFGSGNLKNGTYFYTYQYYNINGKETSFAPLSTAVYVTDKFSKTEYKKISVGKVGENSHKSVLGYITNNTGREYDMVRIVSIYYSSKESTPIINIIEEKLASSSVSFSDSGISLGNLSQEDLLFRNVILTPSTAVSKNNYLFIGNIDKKDYFDVDEWIEENDPDNDGFFLNHADSVNSDKKFWEARAFSFGVYSPMKGEEEYRVNVQSVAAADGVAPDFFVKFDEITYPKYKMAVPNSSGGVKDAYTTPTQGCYIPESSDCIHEGLFDIGEEDRMSNCRVYQEGTLAANNTDLTRFNQTSFGLNPNEKLSNGVPKYGGYGVNVEYYFEPFDPASLNFSDPAFVNFNSDIITPNRDEDGFFSDFTQPDSSKKLIIPFDEIDRYGIQFKENNTGRVSFVKWIGDIRSPEVNSYQDFYNESNPLGIIASGSPSNPILGFKVLKLIFKVKNVPEGLSWRIVRVPKETESDYLNKMTGILPGMYINSSDNLRAYCYPTRQQNTASGLPISSIVSSTDVAPYYSIDKFISPDYLLDNNLAAIIEGNKDNMFFKNAGQVYVSDRTITIGPMGYDDGGYFKNTSGNSYLRTYLSYFSEWRNVTARNLTPVLQADFVKFLGTSDKTDTLRWNLRNIVTPKDNSGNTVKYQHELYNTLGQAASLSGTSLILGFEDYNSDMYKTKNSVENHTAHTGTTPNVLPMISVLENNFYSRFGGPSYEDRAYNIYNPVSPWNTSEESKTTVEGTHYAGIFEYLGGHIYENLSDKESYDYRNLSGNAFIWFPVISRKNFNYGSSSLFRKLENSIKGAFDGTDADTESSPMPVCITEDKGIFALTFEDGNTGVTTSITYLDQEEDYYAYNDVYELNRSMLELALPKPVNYQDTLDDNKITNSRVKIDNEYADSWLKFNKTSLILDYTQGKLIDIFTLNNNIYYFQEKGFGQLYSEERQAVSQGNSSLTIAKGPVLERFNVITNFSGIQDKKHYTTSESAIYWYDAFNKELKMFDGKTTVDLGSFLGISSYIKLLSVKNLDYDLENKELLIISWDVGENDVVIEHLHYSEIHKAIVGKTSYSSLKDNFKEIFHIESDHKFYKILSERGEFSTFTTTFYDKDTVHKSKLIGNFENAQLEFIINPDQTSVSILEYISILIDVFQEGFPTEFENKTSNGEYSHLDMIEKIEFFNSYQTSKTLNTVDLKTHYRKVRSNDLAESTGEKLKDYFHRAIITFKGNGKRMVLREILTGFTRQRI